MIAATALLALRWLVWIILVALVRAVVALVALTVILLATLAALPVWISGSIGRGWRIDGVWLSAALVGATLSAAVGASGVGILPLLLTTLLRILWLTWLASILLPTVMVSAPATRRIGHCPASTLPTSF